MGILDRISTILRSNINAMLDRAEDPEKMLEQITRDMASAIGEARGQVADMIAEQKKLEADMQRNQELATEWTGKAELAVKAGKDDLAREALRRKLDYQNNANAYQQQLTSQTEVVEKLKRDLQELQSRYDSLQRNKGVLIARHRRAEAQKTITKTVTAMAGMDPSSELARMDERIRREEARADAMDELSRDSIEDQFEALKGNSEVESELARLKGQTPGAGGGEAASS